MIRYLEVEEGLFLHRSVIVRSGGSAGLRDAGPFDSAVAQPRMSFGGRDLYPSVAEKAAAMGFSLITTIHSLMATSGSGMWQWKHSSCSMGWRSLLPPMNRKP